MIFGIILAIGLLIGVPILISEIKAEEFPLKGGAVIVLAILAGLVQPYTLERVETGWVGIQVNLIGNKRGESAYQYKAGWVLYNSWTERLYEFPTYQQHIEYPEQVVITKGGFQTTIKPSFNYALIPTNIGDMFQQLRKPLGEVEQLWLKNAIISSVNDVANTWNVDDIFNNRESFESSIIKEAGKRTQRWFTITQLRTNITPPEALKKSILAKTNAIQEVQVAENQKKVAEAEALRKIAEAKGDSAQAVIKAAGEAEAMKLKQRQLTGEYIDFVKWSRWNGVMPSTVLGDKTGFLIQK